MTHITVAHRLLPYLAITPHLRHAGATKGYKQSFSLYCALRIQKTQVIGQYYNGDMS